MGRTDSFSVGIKAQYTFDQLIVGSHNQMAAAASLQVAKQLGEAYNPLFLYGPTGVGKTHMMQAIAHSVLARDPNVRVKYISAERFVNEVISSIAEDNLVGFRQHYGQLDLLLIDDIQFILESRSTQGEFLHVFNNLHQQNQQVVLTCDRSPSQLTNLDKSIRSRLEWGLAADIKIPDLVTRVEILRLKQKNYGIVISDESLQYVAELLNSNVRELEGFLKRLHAYATLSHQEVTTELIQSVLSEIIPEGAEARAAEAAASNATPARTSTPILASMMDVSMAVQATPVEAPAAVPSAPPTPTPTPAPITPAPVAKMPPPPAPVAPMAKAAPPPIPPADVAPPAVELPPVKVVPQVPAAVPVPPEIPAPAMKNGSSHTNGAHELEETFNKLPDIQPTQQPNATPSAEPVVTNGAAVPNGTPPVADDSAIPKIIPRVFDKPKVEAPVAATPPPPPPPPPPVKEVFKRAPIIAPVMEDVPGAPAAPPPPPKPEFKKAPLIAPTIDDAPVPAAADAGGNAGADGPMTEEEMDAEPLPAGHKEVFAVFFYPTGYEKQLDTVVKKFQDVVKKHKLKFRLRRVHNHPYNHKGKIDYNSFVDVCKQNKVPVAIVIGPPPTGSLVTEHEFYDLLSVTLDVQGVSLQMVSWSEIDKDYRYLNLALDIALVRTGRL